MCFFLHIATNDKIPSSTLTHYQQKHDIHLDQINEYLNVTVPQHYYLIHRQCSCDFIREINNSYNELSILFKGLSKPFDMILLDATITPDTNTHLSEIITNRQITESVSLNDFLINYPTILTVSKIYTIVYSESIPF